LDNCAWNTAKPAATLPSVETAMSFLLKAVLGILSLLIVALGGFALLFNSGAQAVEQFCQEIQPGMPITQLVSLAEQRGLSLKLPGMSEASGTYQALVHTVRSYGRHVCWVQHDQQQVLARRFTAMD